jgi:hypothetical protein
VPGPVFDTEQILMLMVRTFIYNDLLVKARRAKTSGSILSKMRASSSHQQMCGNSPWGSSGGHPMGGWRGEGGEVRGRGLYPPLSGRRSIKRALRARLASSALMRSSPLVPRSSPGPTITWCPRPPRGSAARRSWSPLSQSCCPGPQRQRSLSCGPTPASPVGPMFMSHQTHQSRQLPLPHADSSLHLCPLTYLFLLPLQVPQGSWIRRIHLVGSRR